MPHKYDYSVLIARMMPFHAGHFHIIENALKISQKIIIVLGSSNSSRNARNPLREYERHSLIIQSIPEEYLNNIRILYQPDYVYNDAKWLASVRFSINRTIIADGNDPNKISICLVGHSKDNTSYYLKKFPEWESVEIQNYKNLNATTLRLNLLNENYDDPSLDDFYISENHKNAIIKAFQGLHSVRQEYEFVKKYKKQWESSPYPPTFATVDAVVTQAGHVLLVERGQMPGKGLWALPGGFLNPDEKIKDGIIRELKEETLIKIPNSVWEKGPSLIKFFDDPNRSSRGRTITHAGLFVLRDDPELPKVKGSDDAAKAFWCPIEKLESHRHMFFEDHASMIESMLEI